MEMTAIDLFCGSGAVTLGLKSAGFKVIGAVDIDPIACATYRANHPEVNLIENDIGQVDPACFGPTPDQHLDLLAICAPCQPFSTQNKIRSDKDERVGLILYSLKFVEKLMPKMVFFENVPGLGNQKVFQKLLAGLKKLGYFMADPQRIDAANLGVPQRRRRMILVGSRNKQILKKASKIGFCKKCTVRDAIGSLPAPPIGANHVEKDVLHFSRAHTALNIERLKHIPHDGGSRDSLPEKLQLSCHKGCDKNSFPDTYGRLKWDNVAPTLTTGCTDLTRGRYAHPEQNRAITLREAARLQSFPDSYHFKGKPGQIATQIGNAVPPAMMGKIAWTLKQALSDI